MTTFTLARTIAATLIASAFVTLAPVAQAETPDQLPRAEINIKTTDFSSTKAVARLVSQLHRVALEICMPDSLRMAPITSDEIACVDTAFKSGMAQIDSREQQALRDSKINVATAH